MQFIQDLCLKSLFINSILIGPHHKPFHFTWEDLAHHSSFSPEYNVEDARVLLQLSLMITDSVAFDIPLNVPGWLQDYDMKYDACPVSMISEGIPNSGYNAPTTVCRALYNEATNVLLLVFVGTSNYCMGILDMKYQHEEYAGIANYVCGLRGHKGIHQLYMAIRDKLLAVLKEYLPRNPQIVITGHSLGGGLSQIAALDLAGYDPIHYSYAAPMIFNEQGYKTFTRFVKSSYRIANLSDLVTLAPLPVMPNKDAFWHVGRLIYFQRNMGNYMENHGLAYAQEFGLV